MARLLTGILFLMVLLGVQNGSGVAAAAEDSTLTVRQIMQSIIAPMTTILWGAYDIQNDQQWQELENAAVSVIAAGILLESIGTDSSQADWRTFNQKMSDAARAALAAIQNQDEEALFTAGNDQLYPPCESCHQRYMAQ